MKTKTAEMLDGLLAVIGFSRGGDAQQHNTPSPGVPDHGKRRMRIIPPQAALLLKAA